MNQVARAAVGTIQSGIDGQAISLAFLGYLWQQGLQVRHFRSKACFTPIDAGREAAGSQSRHLDSWLMSPETCIEVFFRGLSNCDAALVDGDFQLSHSSCNAKENASTLDTLCQWLGLPRILVLDVPALGRCMLPCRPNAEAVLLDRVPNRSEYCRVKTVIESIWGIPVVGGLAGEENCRATLEDSCRSGQPMGNLCTALAGRFAEYANFEPLLKVFHQAVPLEQHGPATVAHQAWEGKRVAVAYDEAFYCYFADMLDLVESRGARVIDFSPLRDEQLPDADVVFIGCGHPELYAEQLADNQCIQLSLRKHVCEGKPLYAEGAGMAYMCQFLETDDGRQFSMSGVFPAAAFLNRENTAPEPVQAELAEACWLGPQGTQLRGYLNRQWDIRPLNPMPAQVVEKARQGDLLRRRNAIGSRIHLDLAVQSEAMCSLAQIRP